MSHGIALLVLIAACAAPLPAGETISHTHDSCLKAVRKSWFERHQDADGKWSATSFAAHHPSIAPCGPSGNGTDLYATSLCVLALCSTRNPSDHRTIERAVRWLADELENETPRNFDLPLAAFALCEAWKLMPDLRVEDACRRAISRLETQYRKERWDRRYGRYSFKSAMTLGYALLALESARHGGLNVDEELLVTAREWTIELTGRGGAARFANPLPKDKTQTATLTAMLLLARLASCPDDEWTPTRLQSERLTEMIEERAGKGETDSEFWMLSGFATFALGGRPWKAWNRAMKPMALDSNELSCGDRIPSLTGPSLERGGLPASVAQTTLAMATYYRYSVIPSFL